MSWSERDKLRRERLELARSTLGEKRVRPGAEGFGYGPPGLEGQGCLFDNEFVQCRMSEYDNGNIRISVYGTDDFSMERKYFPEQRELAREAWQLIDHGVTETDLRTLGFWNG